MSPRGKPAKRSQSEVIFLSCDLDKQLKKDIVEWLKVEHDFFDMMEKCADSGLKFGAGFDHYNECFQCSLTHPADDDTGGKVLVLVGRGASLLQAMQALFFKFEIIMQGDLENETERQGSRGVADWG